jgi:hypothetical protein
VDAGPKGVTCSQGKSLKVIRLEIEVVTMVGKDVVRKKAYMEAVTGALLTNGSLSGRL